MEQEAGLLQRKALLHPLAAGSSQAGQACPWAIFINSICATAMVTNWWHTCQGTYLTAGKSKHTGGPWSHPFLPVVGSHQLPGSVRAGERLALPLLSRGEGQGEEAGFGEKGSNLR